MEAYGNGTEVATEGILARGVIDTKICMSYWVVLQG